MKKKTIKLTSLMTLCSVLLAGCGMTTNTDTENSTAAINEGGVVNIYCWNDEFKGIYEKYAADIAKQHGVDVNFVIITSDNNAYQTNLDEALADQDEAIDDDKVDLFMIETNFVAFVGAFFFFFFFFQAEDGIRDFCLSRGLVFF